MKSAEKIREIVNLIERLSRLMRAHEHDTALTPAQWEAMRYLARCNRFSNSPKALTSYLMSTKGTVSQTLMALERKGLIEKNKREGQNRSIELQLTDLGRRRLEREPWQSLYDQIASLGDAKMNSLHHDLQSVLLAGLEANQNRSFGICRTCRHFAKNRHPENDRFPHRCQLLDVPLGNEDSIRICAEHQFADAR